MAISIAIGESAPPSETGPELDQRNAYRTAVEEYRFQVQLNWSRTQYYLAFNVGLIGVATGLLQFVDFPLTWICAGLYAAGVTCCVLSLVASQVQHDYYRNTRDRLKHLEKLIGIEQIGIVTTARMGGRTRRLGRVTTMNLLVFCTLLALNAGGVLLVVLRSFGIE